MEKLTDRPTKELFGRKCKVPKRSFVRFGTERGRQTGRGAGCQAAWQTRDKFFRTNFFVSDIS
jgi:hypothetical protein